MNNNEFLTMFEKELSLFTGAPYVVLVDSCTNAIFLCLKHFKPKSKKLTIPNRTYLSVPQSIIHAGYKPKFKNIKWNKSYEIGNTNIHDYAVGFERNMYKSNEIQCISFQQKKCINIGKGGAILLNNKHDYKILKRLSFDGRDGSVSVSEDKCIILGYHMNMTPDDAAKGTLILNQTSNNKILQHLGNYKQYPKLKPYFKDN